MHFKEDVMLMIAKKVLVITLITALMIIPFGSAALAEEYFETEEASGASMMYDFILVRPVGIVATAVGSVFFIVSLPFSALGDNVAAASEKLVKEPAAFTFKRPLGEF